LILVDTSIWIDHLRVGDRTLVERLEAGLVLTHPFVIGEIALGNLGNRAEILEALARLPAARPASDSEVFELIERRRLYGLGIGLVDAHLIAATLLTPDCSLWSRDRRLVAVAGDLGASLISGR
jgi:hypothetical protein